MRLEEEFPTSIALLAAVNQRAQSGDVLVFKLGCRTVHGVEALLMSFSSYDDGNHGSIPVEFVPADLVARPFNHRKLIIQDTLIVVVRDTAAVDYDLSWNPLTIDEETKPLLHHGFEVLDSLFLAGLIANTSRPLTEVTVHVCDNAGNTVSCGLMIIAICPRMRDVYAHVQDRSVQLIFQ